MNKLFCQYLFALFFFPSVSAICQPTSQSAAHRLIVRTAANYKIAADESRGKVRFLKKESDGLSLSAA
jgi:hypothetical protein